MKRASSWILGACAATMVLVSCGGEDGGSPTNPGTPPPAATATPTPAATATAAPTATAVPTPIEPDEDANPGPVATVFTKVFVVRDKQGGNQIFGKYADTYPGTPYYDPTTDKEMVPVGSFFIIDTTPKNAAGKKCQSNAPQWVVDHGGKFEPLGNNGVGSNAFQYRANAKSKGTVTAYTFIENVRSNVINIQVY